MTTHDGNGGRGDRRPARRRRLLLMVAGLCIVGVVVAAVLVRNHRSDVDRRSRADAVARQRAAVADEAGSASGRPLPTSLPAGYIPGVTLSAVKERLESSLNVRLTRTGASEMDQVTDTASGGRLFVSVQHAGGPGDRLHQAYCVFSGADLKLSDALLAELTACVSAALAPAQAATVSAWLDTNRATLHRPHVQKWNFGSYNATVTGGPRSIAAGVGPDDTNGSAGTP